MLRVSILVSSSYSYCVLYIDNVHSYYALQACLVEGVVADSVSSWRDADYRLCIFTEIEFYLNQDKGGWFSGR